MAKKTFTPRQQQLLQMSGPGARIMQNHLWLVFDKVREDRGIDRSVKYTLEIEYGKPGTDGVWKAWRVHMSLDGRTALVENHLSTWLPTQAARLEILEAFDELCTQYLELAR